MSKRNWTPPQKAAIEDRNGFLLVSAAAGSGKTAVLVERVIEIICDDQNPVDITQLLVATFSNGAAAEMRQRVGERLAELIMEGPENTYLQHQQNLLGSANISTVHSFCINLIRENFHNLPIAADFSIADQSELELLKDEAVTAAVDDVDSGEDSVGFTQLLDQFSSGKDDRKLIETVYKVYDFARSHPFYEDWLQRKLEMYTTDAQPQDTVWGEIILDFAGETMEYAKKILTDSKNNYILGDEKLEKSYLPSWLSDISQISGVLDAIREKRWDDGVKLLSSFEFLRLGGVRGDDSEKERAKEGRATAKKLVESIRKNYLNATASDFKGDIEDLLPKIRALFQLVKNYGDNFSRLKARGKKLDFSDLEHFALQLLVEKRDGNYIATETAEEISKSFSYILVDEYQDTNEVQDLIFTSISQNQENLFLVGDVKQSIYSFRLAMPEIFISKKKNSFPYDGTNYPAVINLDTNFRSRHEVTEGVNFLFSQLMSEKLGEVDYNESESLKSADRYPKYPRANPEFLLISGEDYEGELDSTELEAREVGRKISELLDSEYEVQGKNGELRKITPGDICVLMRSPRGRTDLYVKALMDCGVSSRADNSGGFLESREIGVMTSLLTAVDNPLMEVELVGAMLSPLFDFSDDEVGELRLMDKKAPFYTIVVRAAAEGNDKCEKLLEVFAALRHFALSHTVDEVIMEAYRITNWTNMVRGMSFGEGRRGNLLLLVEYAKYYDSVGYKGLGGFMGLLSRIRESGKDLDSAVISGEGGNEVTILSVHRSKGLEFPVVILADTARRFNMQDLNDNVLIHSTQGIGTMRRNSENMSQYSTVPRGAVRLAMHKTMLSEELRILYVALTRAKEKLIISGVVKKDVRKYLSGKVWQTGHGKLPSFGVEEQNSYCDWIVMALLHHPNGGELRALAGEEDLSVIADENNWNIEIIVPEAEEQAVLSVGQAEWKQEADKELYALLKTRMDFVYPHEGETTVPTKLAVSDIVRSKEGDKYIFGRRPKFMHEKKLTPTERGNALHKFMQFADYEGAKADLHREIQRIEKNQFLSSFEVESLSISAIEAFFKSDLADRIFASPKVYRELRFISEFGKEELGDILPNMSDDSKIVVQGIADCVFVENDKAFVVDYKTDNIKDLGELEERYASQLAVYEKIINNTLGLEVGGSILYSFAISQWKYVSTQGG